MDNAEPPDKALLLQQLIQVGGDKEIKVKPIDDFSKLADCSYLSSAVYY